MEADITWAHGTVMARPGRGPVEASTTEAGDGTGAGDETDAAAAVTALYRCHALGLTRLAYVMLGDRHAAEDVVQEAFCNLYRAWDRLTEHDRALGYLRVSVLNGCRSVLRRSRRVPKPLAVPHAPSAEDGALVGEQQRAAVAALRRLPPRQREALVLRYFADLTESAIAQAMGVSRGTVKSTTARALAALDRMLREEDQ